MKKVKNLVALSVVTFILLLGSSVYAATANFSGTLPANQGDTEVSTVAKANNVDQFFSIKVSSLGGNGSAVRAWTESSVGANYSSPYNQANKGVTTWIYYSSVPGKGKNVTLNLDNPVYTSSTVSVSGSWSPN